MRCMKPRTKLTHAFRFFVFSVISLMSCLPSSAAVGMTVLVLQCVTVMKAMGNEQIVTYKEESG